MSGENAPEGRLVAGRYRLGDMLGRGGMGTVWRATDELLAREVALKRLRLVDVPDEEAALARERTLREARIAASLHHPQIVTIFDVVVEGAEPWLVLEYLPSVSLGDMLRERGPLPVTEVASIGAQVAAALAAAHAAGIVHRDVKPDNVLVAGPTAKLTDFGISSATTTPSASQTGTFAGTPAYLAPETCRGDGMDARSDVYALGATLYAAAEGQPPFGTSGSLLALIGRIAQGEAPPPLRAGALTGVIMSMLADNPATRPDAARVLTDLTRIAGGPASWAQAAAPRTTPGTTARAKPAAPARTAAGPASTPTGPPRTTAGPTFRTQPTPARAGGGGAPTNVVTARAPSRPRWHAVALVGALGVVATLALVGLGGDPPPPPAPPPTTQPTPAPILAVGEARTADPCSLIDMEALGRFGTATLNPAEAAFAQCRADLVPASGGTVGLLIEFGPAGVGSPVTANDRIGLIELHRRAPSPTACRRDLVLPYGDVVAVSAQRPDPGAEDLCAIADTGAYAAARLLTTRGVAKREPLDLTSPLAGIDACVLLAPIDLLPVPGPDARRIHGFGGWSCDWTAPAGPGVHLTYFRGAPPPPEAATDIGGHAAATVPTPESCRVDLVQGRARGRADGPADLVRIVVIGAGPDGCARATVLAAAAAGRLPAPS